MDQMTSRQRVRLALSRRVPDRVPIDLGGNQTGIHRVAYQALIEHLGIQEEIEIVDAVQQLAQPSEAVLQRLRGYSVHSGVGRERLRGRDRHF